MRRGALGLAAVGLVFAAVVALPDDTRADRDPRWNFVVIVTDDQSFDSLPHDPPVMPYLQAAMADPDGHWVEFRNGFVNTPLCCPSRATLLTGRYAHQHGVQTNDDGPLLDERATIASWLDQAGYHTGLVGKYLNQYPFGRIPFVPEGWDRWWGKAHGPVTNLYRGYTVIEQEVPITYGSAPEDYATDVFADRAVEFIRDAPMDQPFLLWFAPTAPHPPWVSAPRHAGRYATMSVSPPPSVGEVDVADKPAWVRELPALGPVARADLRDQRRRSFEALLAVDDAVHDIVDALDARGDLDRTVIVYLSDNGYSFGEHRWVKKICPYEECTAVPFLVRYPSARGRAEDVLVSAVDVVPTLADLAGVNPPDLAGRSLVPLLEAGDPTGLTGAVYSEWVGDDRVPGWTQVRTSELAYIELATGERELYDLRADPLQLQNVAADPAYAQDVLELSSALSTFRGS